MYVFGCVADIQGLTPDDLVGSFSSGRAPAPERPKTIRSCRPRKYRERQLGVGLCPLMTLCLGSDSQWAVTGHKATLPAVGGRPHIAPNLPYTPIDQYLQFRPSLDRRPVGASNAPTDKSLTSLNERGQVQSSAAASTAATRCSASLRPSTILIDSKSMTQASG